MITKYKYTFLFGAVIGVAIVLLFLQIPFAYYSGDNVFHIAKISASADGEYFTDPITGCQSIYPPYFHIFWGNVSGIFDLNGFQISRLIQAINFLGLFLSGFFLLYVILKDTEKASLSALAIGLLIYAPTGKYIFLQSPYNFSVMFILTGTSLLLLFYQSQKMKYGIASALMLGWGINIWWWNIIPVGGLLAGMILVCARENRRLLISPKFLVAGAVLGLMLCMNLWPLSQIRAVLPNYNYDMIKYSFAGQHSFIETILAWLTAFIFKGNQQFFKHLFPAALDSSSRVVLLYGLVASIYYYLLVLPFNYLMISVSVKQSLMSFRKKQSGTNIILLSGAIATFLLSIVALYRADQSVVRRIQFYAFLFLLPAFCYYLWNRFDLLERHRRLTAIACSILSLALIFTVVYRFEINAYNNLPAARSEVIRFIENLPNHAHTRIFLTEPDTQILAREVRFRSFILSGHPTYFRQDEKQADSVYNAYISILNRAEDARASLVEFETKYAIVGKSPVNLSPVISKVAENSLSESMIEFFDNFGTVRLENDNWVIFELPQ